jgi:hypothetical protein
MATKSTHGTEGPMTLGNMRANGVSSLTVQCHKCWHEVVIDALRSRPRGVGVGGAKAGTGPLGAFRLSS